jgi:uncharacterized UBP type Zn finger protein
MTSETPGHAPEARVSSVRTIGRYLENELRRVTFQRSLARRTCIHLTGEDPPRPAVPACPACVHDSTTWVKLRMCLSCGSVGCCDTSVGRHAVGHFKATGHPVMRSIEPGDAWGWCYPEKAYIELGPA